MLNAAHEGREPALVACTPPFAAEPSNNELFVFAVENGSPEEMLTTSGADRFGRCRLHADIYEPIVNYLVIAGGIVKRGSALETSNRGDHSMLRSVSRPVQSAYPAGPMLHRPDPIMIVAEPSFVVELAYIKLPF